MKLSRMIWLKGPESFQTFLEKNSRKPAKVKQEKRPLDQIGKLLKQEHCRTMRESHYCRWLKMAESLMYLDFANNPLKNGVIRLMIGLDYKKLYDAMLFEFQHYLTRACFCRLALHYKVDFDQSALNYELDQLIKHIKNLMDQNLGLSEQKDFKSLFAHSYRSALIELCLYHKVKASVSGERLFSVEELLSVSVREASSNNLK